MNIENIISEIRRQADIVDSFRINSGDQVSSLTATVDEEPGECQAIIANDKISILYTSEENFKGLRTDRTIVNWYYLLTIDYNGDEIKNAHLHYEVRNGLSTLNSCLLFDINFDTDVERAIERLNTLSGKNDKCTISKQIHINFDE